MHSWIADEVPQRLNACIYLCSGSGNYSNYGSLLPSETLTNIEFEHVQSKCINNMSRRVAYKCELKQKFIEHIPACCSYGHRFLISVSGVPEAMKIL